MDAPGTLERPLRVAIVGSGPSGFYAAHALFEAPPVVQADLFDRLPTPFGLVRGGVAPDHPHIKQVTRTFERIARHDRFAFLGNVTVGRDIRVEELRRHYDAVIFAYGSARGARLDIPGESLQGSHGAMEFVGWYNGHPDYAAAHFDLSVEVVAVVGHGNAALDVARILMTPVDALRHTDMPDYALDALAESAVREIHLIGRRGPVQAKFTPSELRELGRLQGWAPVVDPNDLDLNPASRAELDRPRARSARKNLEILAEFAAAPHQARAKPCVFHFLESPVALQGNTRVEALVLERNRLSGDPGAQRAIGTGETHTLACGVLFQSLGHRGVPIAGAPFDEARGILPNDDGRVLDRGRVVPELYATGWIKRGAGGIIGTNKADSARTVAALLRDAATLEPCPEPDSEAVKELLDSRGVQVVSFDDWRRIDAIEIARGRPKGKPREKCTRVQDMLNVLNRS